MVQSISYTSLALCCCTPVRLSGGSLRLANGPGHQLRATGAQLREEATAIRACAYTEMPASGCSPAACPSYAGPACHHVSFDIRYCMWSQSTSLLFGWQGRSRARRSPLAPESKPGFCSDNWQQGLVLGLPHSRPMPSIGRACHELRIQDERQTWRIVYRIDPDAIVVVEVFSKKTASTPSRVIGACQQRLKHFDRVSRGVP